MTRFDDSKKKGNRDRTKSAIKATDITLKAVSKENKLQRKVRGL